MQLLQLPNGKTVEIPRKIACEGGEALEAWVKSKMEPAVKQTKKSTDGE
jgi:hypothetical protein